MTMLAYSNYGEWAIDQAIAEGVEGIRCDNENGQSEPELVPQFLDKKIRPLFLVHDVAMVQPLLDAIIPVQDRLLEPAIEIFNELEEGRVTKEIYVQSITQAYHDARSRGFTGRIIAGGLANLSRNSLDFYQAVLDKMPLELGPSGLTIGFHDYTHKTQTGGYKAWPGTGSPGHAIEILRTYARGRDLACTEHGAHTMIEEEGFWIFKKKTRLTNEQAYQFNVESMERHSKYRCVLSVIYQWRDGPEMPSFGMHTASGVPKPQLDAINDWRS